MARHLLACALALCALIGGHARAGACGLPVADDAIELIVSFEIGSQALYVRRYQQPIWPGAASGVTIGIGYDLGHQRAATILMDWHRHDERARLASMAGITGTAARAALPQVRDIIVTWDHAIAVFRDASLIEYCRRARRAFGPASFDAAPPLVRGALVSLVYNRGASMTGPARAEMRHIRDVCLPAGDAGCVADQIRAMTRLWRGSSIEAGMQRRRYAEAALAARAGSRAGRRPYSRRRANGLGEPHAWAG